MSRKENSRKLFEAFGMVEEDYIDECLLVNSAKNGRSVVLKMVCAAAVLVLAVSVVTVLTARLPPSFSKPGNAVELSEGDYMPTSEKYESLEELLQSVKHKETNNQDEASSGRVMYKGSQTAEGYNAASSAVVYKDYAYHITEGGVSITRLSSSEPNFEGVINARAENLLLCNDKLALFRTDYDDPLGGKPTVTTELYDLSSPEAPELVDAFTQSGSYVESFAQNGKVYLMTSDGVCACGYSRGDGVDEYMPKITHNGESVTVDEDRVFILGEPTSIRFTTLTAYSMSEKNIICTDVFYGDTDKCFSGMERMALCVESRGELYSSTPVLYIFDIKNDAEFIGKVNLSAALDIPAMWLTGSSDERAEVIYAELSGDTCRVIGTVYSSNSNQSESEIYALSADVSSGKCRKTLSQKKDALAAIDEIVDMGGKKLIISSAFDINTMQSSARLCCADFSGELPVITESSFEIDAVSGVDMLFSYGRPYGELFPTMVLDEGIAVRYNGIPNGMDILDISDPSDMKLLYSSGNIFGNDEERFLIEGGALSEKHIAVLKANPQKNKEGEFDYRLLDFQLCIYEIKPNEAHPIQLVSEYAVNKCDSIELIEHDGAWYCANTGYSAPDGAIVKIDLTIS